MADPVSVGIIVTAAAYVARPAAQDFLKRISGPLATELGEAMADPVREWRARRAAAAVTGSKDILEGARIEPQPVSPKLLVSIAEASSLEDDDALTARWSALLANAAAGALGAAVRPRFVAVLQQLTALDAALLQQVGETGPLSASFPDIIHLAALPRETAPDDAIAALDTLLSLGLVEREGTLRHNGVADFELVTPDEQRVHISRFGRAFLSAVTPPGHTAE